MSLKTKLIGLMVLILGATFLVSYTIFDRGEAELLQQVVQHVKSLENVGNVLEIQQFLTRSAQRTLQHNLLLRMGQGGRAVQVSLLDLHHTVIASSTPEDVGLSLKELEDIRVNRAGDNIWDRLLKKHINTYDVTFPVYENGMKRGYINIVLIMNDLEYLIKKAKYSNIVWIGIIFIAGTAIAVFTVNRFTKPIEQLVAASKAVAEGNFHTRVNSSGGGELQILISGFNEMAAKLQEHKALEQRVHRSEHMAALGELGARLAHEIRNPLNSISLIVDHLRDRFSPQEARRQQKFDTYVTNIKTELQRLNKLVSDFLQVSRPLHPDMKVIPLQPLLQQIVQLLENEAAQRGIDFYLDIESDDLNIRADEGLMKTAYLNISLNAIQAMEEGGRLCVKADTCADDQKTHGPLCRISFTDTGPGIPTQHQESIFQPYFTTKEEGTGLGLSIVNRVIEDHRGTIDVKSEEGHGTTITLLLPIAEGA